MQVTQAEKIRLGLFIILVIGVFIGIIAIMIGKKISKQEVSYHIKFEESVDGLLEGAEVKLRGVTIGRVAKLDFDPADVSKIVVTIQIREGIQLKTDMVANLTGGLSITGLKSVEISGGSNHSDFLKPGSEIKAGTSQIQLLTGHAEAIAAKFETLLNQLLLVSSTKNQTMLLSTIENFGKVAYTFDRFLEKNSEGLSQLPQDASQTLKSIRKVADESEALLLEIKSQAPGKKIGETLSSLQSVTQELKEVIHEADLVGALKQGQLAAENFSTLTKNLDQSVKSVREDLPTILSKFREVAENMEDFSRIIRDNPSLLLRIEEKKERDR